MDSYSFNIKNLDLYPQGLDLSELAIKPNFDAIALDIATYLADGLNHYYYLNYQRLAVKNILSYDAIIADNSQFPLLKVYRINDRYMPDSNTRKSQMAVTYSLLVPEQRALPGLLNWLSVALNTLLNSYHHNHQGYNHHIVLENRTGEYRIMLNEINNYAYPFFRMEFTIEEISYC